MTSTLDAQLVAATPDARLDATAELVREAAPEVILEFRCGRSLTESQELAYFRDWQALEGVPAVDSSRIFFITESHGLRPGPRYVDIARHIALQLHSELEPRL